MPHEEPPQQEAEKPIIPGETYNFETTSVNGQLYNVELLESFAEQIEPQEMPLEELRYAVAEGHYYWLDRNNQKLGPHQILQDWDAAQQNEAWADHIETIKRANLANPIWIAPNGMVCNGMHRLTRAFLDGLPAIKARKFTELPSEAIVQGYKAKKN